MGRVSAIAVSPQGDVVVRAAITVDGQALADKLPFVLLALPFAALALPAGVRLTLLPDL